MRRAAAHRPDASVRGGGRGLPGRQRLHALRHPRHVREPMRHALTDMANCDDHHACLLRERFAGVGGLSIDGAQRLTVTERPLPCSPWLRLRHILAEKRELYECYRQEVSRTDDLGSQTLLRYLRDAEERHQEQLITMLTHLDAHVHETIT